MTQRAATELKAGIIAEDPDERRHMPNVDAAGCDRHDSWHGAEFLIEEDAARAVFRNEAFTHQIDPAQGCLPVTLELTDHGARVKMVAA